MVQRISPQFNPGSGISIAANPVNTAVYAPRVAQSNTLLDLATSLEKIQPELSQYTHEARVEQNEEDFEEGKKARIKSALSYKDAVEKGEIRPDQSPFFMQAYKEQDARVKGQTFLQKTLAEYQGWDGKDSDNPQAYQEFISTKSKEFLESEQDPEVANFLTAEVSKVQNNLGQIHASYTGQRVYQGMLDKSAEAVGGIVDGELAAAAAERRAVDPSRISAQINLETARGRFVGVSGTDLNKTYVDAIANAAERSGNTAILRSLELARPDGTPGPGKTAYGRKVIEQAETSIESKNMQRANFAYQQEERAKARQTDGLYRSLLGNALNTSLPDEQRFTADPATMAALIKVNPQAAYQVNGMMRSLQANQDSDASRDNPATVTGALNEAFSGRLTPERLSSMISAGEIKNPDNVRSLWSAVNSRSADDDKVFKNKSVQAYLKNFDTSIDPMGFASKFQPEVLLNAQTGFIDEMTDWGQKNPTAGPLEVSKRAKETFDHLIQEATQSLGQPAQPGAKAPVGSPKPPTAVKNPFQ